MKIKLTPKQLEAADWLLGCIAFETPEDFVPEFFEGEPDIENLTREFAATRIENGCLVISDDWRVRDEAIENLERLAAMTADEGMDDCPYLGDAD